MWQSLRLKTQSLLLSRFYRDKLIITATQWLGTPQSPKYSCGITEWEWVAAGQSQGRCSNVEPQMEKVSEGGTRVKAASSGLVIDWKTCFVRPGQFKLGF